MYVKTCFYCWTSSGNILSSKKQTNTKPSMLCKETKLFALIYNMTLTNVCQTWNSWRSWWKAWTVSCWSVEEAGRSSPSTLSTETDRTCLEGHWKGVFLRQKNPSGQGAYRWGSQLSEDTWTKMWDRGSTVQPADTHTVSKNQATVPLKSWRA